MSLKTYRLPTPEWRRNFFSTKKGIPTTKQINAAIDRGEISGSVIAGVHVVYCNAEHEPIEISTQQAIEPPQEKTSNPIALRILKSANVT